LKAIDEMMVSSAQADPKLLNAAADAHHKAIGSISGPNRMTSKGDWEAMKAALGRVVASVPEVIDERLRSGVPDHGPMSASIHEVACKRC